MKREASWIVALMMAALGAYIYQQSLDMPDNVSWFTESVGGLMAFLSVILAAREFRAARLAAAGAGTGAGEPPSYLMVVVVLALTVAYLYMLERGGYLYVTTVYFAVMMWVLGLRSLLLLPLVAVGGSASMYFLFVRLLHVTLG